MTKKKQKYTSTINKKFFQNSPGSYFDYMMNGIIDVVENVTTTDQPEEFEAVIVSQATTRIRKI